MDTSIAIMVDMSIHSGKNRLFVYDFKQKAITIEGLCAHGVGGDSTPTKVVFSNKEGSYCTSSGKYKVKGRTYSNWGINVHYKMYGLEETNSKHLEGLSFCIPTVLSPIMKFIHKPYLVKVPVARFYLMQQCEKYTGCSKRRKSRYCFGLMFKTLENQRI
nr:murein L,D-transpeptidase catalytic domain family protein [Pedobacter sp. KBW01]